MRKTITSRLVITYLVVLLLSMFLQAGAMMIYYSNSINDESRKELMDEAKLLAEISPQYLDAGISQDYLRLMASFAQRNHGVVWYVDRMGKLYEIRETQTDAIVDKYSEGVMSDTEIKQYLLKAIAGERVEFVNGFSSRFGHPMYSVGYPVSVYSVLRQETDIVGAVFIHKEVSLISRVSTNMVLSGLGIAAVFAVIGSVAVMLMSRQITKPIKTASEHAKRVASGQYDEQLPVEGPEEIRQFSESFNQMAVNLDRQIRMQNGFVANVSHELRSPMTSIQGFAEGMLDGTIAQEDYPVYLSLILDESRRMNRLIHDLLDLSLMDARKIPLNAAAYDLNEQIRRVILSYYNRMEAKGVDLQLSFQNERCFVSADPDRINQVLVNLIDNALRHTEKGDVISIMTVVYEGKVHVTIGDTGEGISASALPYIFDRFYKEDQAHTRKDEGTGIGLSLVKSIIDMHKQTIRVWSEEGKGTRFTFTLDTAEDPQPHEEEAEEEL